MAAARFRSLFSGFFGRARFEKSMSEEIEFHVESRIEDLVARGTPLNEAQRQARLEFGSAEKYKDEMRSARGLRCLDELRDDIFYGSRILRRSWSFAAVATMSLALGIGVNTLVFSVVNSTLLKPMSYANPDRLVVVWTTPAQNPQQTGTSSVSTYFGLRDQAQSLESVGAFNGAGCGVKTLGADRDGAPAERLFGQCFSPSLFNVLGIKPFMGRTFTDAEDQVGNVAPVVLISHGLWQRRFGSDPNIVSKTIDFNLTPTSVIGVLPADFELFKDPNAEATRGMDIDFVVPLELTPTQVQSKVGGLTIVGRLKPEVSINQANAEIEAIAARLASSDPERHQGLGAHIDAFDRAAYRDYRSPLLLLEGAVAFVLLISCANVAGLLLARTASRRSEVALRIALGARRSRIVRQFITESLPITLLGGIGGVVLSTLGLSVFVATAPTDFPHLDQIAVDARVLGFTALVIVLTSVLSSVVPAIQASKVNIGDPLKESTRSTGGGGQQRLRSLLVMGQIALALVLLICSGLIVRSFVRVLQSDLGADPVNLLTFDFRMTQGETVTPAGRYRGLGLWNISPVPAHRVEQVLDRLQSVPGVQGVAAINTALFRSQTMYMPFVVEGQPVPSDRQQQVANYFAVTRGFFKVMRTRILRGRDFDNHDNADSAHVMIINETMARQFFSNVDPLGKHVTLDWVPNERPWEIVGVVQDTASSPLQLQQAPAVYVPHLQQPPQFTGPGWYTRAGMYFVVRTAVEPMTLLAAVKTAAADIDRNTPVADVRTARQTILNQVRNLRLYMLLLGVFGIVATVLAATGIYGVMAYSVTERTREIGIRIALGGRIQDVLMMVFRNGMTVIVIGLAAGLVSSLAITRLIRSFVFGITLTDPVTYITVSVLVLLIGLLACMVPARRAASVDPTVALKYE
jgi:putative ABC transport system permease protein